MQHESAAMLNNSTYTFDSVLFCTQGTVALGQTGSRVLLNGTSIGCSEYLQQLEGVRSPDNETVLTHFTPVIQRHILFLLAHRSFGKGWAVISRRNQLDVFYSCILNLCAHLKYSPLFCTSSSSPSSSPSPSSSSSYYYYYGQLFL